MFGHGCDGVVAVGVAVGAVLGVDVDGDDVLGAGVDVAAWAMP